MIGKKIALVKFGKADEAFQIKDFEIPAIKEHEVLVEVEASGLNFADIMARRGMYGPVSKLPFILGYDIVGKVIKVGTKADTSLLNKRVGSLTRFGGYASHVALNAQGVVAIEDDFPKEKAIAFSTAFLTAYLMAEEYAGIAHGKKALVYSAAGGVGYFLYHFLKLKGVQVTPVVGNQQKADLLKTLGIKEEIILQSAIESTATKYDLIYNARGGKTVKADLKKLQKGGKLIMFGAADQLNSSGILGKLKLFFGFGFHSPIKLIVNCQALCGFNLLSFSAEKPAAVLQAHQKAIKIIQDQNIPIIESTGFAPNDASKAHALMESGKSTGKIFIDWTK